MGEGGIGEREREGWGWGVGGLVCFVYFDHSAKCAAFT